MTLDVDVFSVSLVVLVLVLMVLLILCWIVRRNQNRDVTVLQVSSGRSGHLVTVKAGSEEARQLLDRLLDRVILEVETRPKAGGECPEEPGSDPQEDSEGEDGSDPEDPGAASAAGGRAHNAFGIKLRRWCCAGSPQSASPCPPPAAQDPADDLCPQQASVSSEAARQEEEQQQAETDVDKEIV